MQKNNPEKMEKRWSVVTMPTRKLALFKCFLILLSNTSHGGIFDFYLLHDALRNATEGEEACRSLGYDGFAVVNSPEAYAHAMEITYNLWSQTTEHVFIGLERDEMTGDLIWKDGTSMATDVPWYDASPNNERYGRIIPSGLLHSGNGVTPKYSICGNQKNLPRELRGSPFPGQQLWNVTSTLSELEVLSYLSCVMLCGQDNRCRAAEFDQSRLWCRIVGPGSYTGLIPNSEYSSFVRVGYS